MPPSDQVLTVAQMQAAEQALIDGGESVDSLMLKAGRGAAEWIFRLAVDRPVTVLCGPGNNGGDGYVIAETLRAWDLPVTVVAPLEPATDAARNARTAYWGGFSAVGHGGVFVDCLFGSGLSRPLGDELAGLVRTLAGTHASCVAVDLPSGISSDDGVLLNEDLPRYDLTVALGAWKFAHRLLPARKAMGELRLVDIGVARVDEAARVISRPALAAPTQDAHKYTRGLLAIVEGPMPGAAALAASGAVHAGAGYIKVLGEASGLPVWAVADPRPLDEALEDRRIAALLVGPGLGRDGAAEAKLEAALAFDLPTLVDADALHLLNPAMVAGRSAPLVITPHAGEFAALAQAFGVEAEGRIDAVRALASAVGGVVGAKGPDTLVAGSNGRLAIAPPASSWLSTAGTGDVLAGIIASRLASGDDAFAAACHGVWLHGEAARRAGPAFSASELAAHVSGAYAACL
ncbi:NAD(P)H-hydrate epimerase [Altererythrobacter salegens]|uniref:Bifunctional NAD(P)H-hydrate repair enzyme n=1 Tax=Croceibacterium salegens TaxID=1737568 RepID=A0A6I4SU90_9SPHN|nr:NAD(P)H-hydrate epimerase [Croceibacterium salegens]MXO59515.1 NAD(P)H-hydrate epimerase [Croceibacterium salegens]